MADAGLANCMPLTLRAFRLRSIDDADIVMLWFPHGRIGASALRAHPGDAANHAATRNHLPIAA